MQTLTSTRTRRRLALLLLVSYCASPLMVTAQVVINAGTPNDGRRAYVDQTQNGLPKVNIATPNGAGVSRNTYSDFNVGKQGLILNNGAGNSNTALAGWVEGNPNLTPGNEAKLIFNEVVGTRQSQLNGFLEVAGKKADVIVANENGVTCNGCGFINTSRATLTTGAAIWGSSGALDGLKIRQGAVTIGADGLSGPDSRVDLLSQVINVQGSIHADKINLIAGGNDVRYDDLNYTKQSDIKGTLDIAALGGMYANQIQLVATGTGVGVRVDGTLISAGNVSITSEGQLVNAGSIHAQGQLHTQATDLENSGTLNGQTLDVSVDKFLNWGAGTVASNQESVIHATTLNNLGRIHTEGATTFDTRRVNNSGVMEATGRLAVNQAWTVENSGHIRGGDVTIISQALGNTGRIEVNSLDVWAYATALVPPSDRLTDTTVNNTGLVAADRISVTGFNKLINTNQISTDIVSPSSSIDSGKLLVQADTLDNTGGRIVARGNLDVVVANLNNAQSTLSTKGNLSIVASQNIINDAGLILHQGTGTALLQAASAISNAAGQIEGQGQSLTIKAGDLINIKGKISGAGDVSVTAVKLLTDASSASLSSGASLSFLDKSKASTGNSTTTSTYNWQNDIAASTAVINAKTAVDSATTAVTSAQSAANTAATNLQTAQSALTVLQANTSSTPSAISQAKSNVTAAQTTYDTAQTSYSSAQSTLTTAQKTYADALAAVPTIDFGTSGTASAQQTKPSDLTAPTPPQITLSTPTSLIQAGRDLAVHLEAGLLDNRQGQLVAAHDVTVTTQGDVLAGQMQAGNALSITAKQLEVDQQLQSKNTNLTADSLVVSGRVQGVDSLTIQANSLNNSGTLTGNATDISGRTSATSLDLGNTGMIQGNNSLSIRAKQILNQATLSSGGDLSTTTAQKLENQALIFSVGHQKHYGVDIVNNAGRFYALGDITMQGNAAGDNATSILNYIGRIEAQGHIDLRAATITNRAALPTVNARGIVTKTNDGTTILTQAKDTFNTDGKTAEILAEKNLNLRADEVDNEYGIISAKLNATIGTRLLKNRSLGAIQTENYVVRAACFNCHQTVSYHDSWGGVIASGGTATINATTVDNQTSDTRDGFAGLSTDPRVVIVDERSNTRSPLTQAFIDRFGIVTGPAASTAGTASALNLGSPRALSDGIVLTASGQFDFSHYILPNGNTGLFEVADAASPYLIRGRSDLYAPATNGQYTTYSKFLGSDYLLTRLGIMPVGFKRLGDAWYETQLVQDQLYALTGRTHLAVGTDTDYDLMLGLMDAGLLAQAKFGLSAGDSLSAAQQAALTQDIVWPEWQVVDGQRVMVPKVYIAHAGTNNDAPKGARIVGTDVAITTRELKNSGTLVASNSLVINASGTVRGGGSYSGGKTVAIVADTVDLKSASIQSGGWLNIDTANDLTLTATQVKAAGDARLSAGGNIALNAEKHESHVVRGNGVTKDEVRYETTNVQSGGRLTIQATKNVVAQGSKLIAESDIKLSSVQGNVDLQAVVDSESVKNTANLSGGLFGLLAALRSNNSQSEDVKGVQINAGGNSLVQANQGDVKAQSLQLQASQQAAVVAGGAVEITSEQAYSRSQRGSDVRQSLVTERSRISGDQGVTVYGQNSVQLDAATLKTTQGDLSVISSGNVSLGVNTDTQQHNWTTSSTSSSWAGLNSSSTTTQHETLDKTAQVTQLEGQTVKVLGNNVKSEGAKLDGAKLVQVEGVNNTQLYAVQDVHQATQSSQTSSSFVGISYSKSSSTDSSFKSEALGTKLTSDQAIQVGVGAVTDVQGAILTAPKVDFVRSAGADTSRPGELILGGSANTTQTSHTEKTTTAGVYQELSGQGETKQTLNQTQLNGKVNVAAGINTTVVIPEGDLKNQVQALSQQPGMAYIGELAKDPRVNWQQVKLAYDKWDYSQEGLTQAGALIIVLVVAYLTLGTGSELAGTVTEGSVAGSSTSAVGGTTLATTTTTAGVSSTLYTAEGAALNAGFTAASSQAAVTLVNNKGDVGKTLQDLGKIDSVKNIITSAVTAGALQNLNPDWMKQLSNTGQFTDKAVINLTNAAVSASIKTAIQGGSYEDNLQTSLKTAGIDTVAGWAASNIGEAYKGDLGALKDQYLAHKVAHALVGCASAAAKDTSCAAGAIGGAVGEAFAEFYTGSNDGSSLSAAKQQEVLTLSKLVTAAVAGMTGKDAQAAVDAAQNAVLNNWLFVSEEKALKTVKTACASSGPLSENCQKQAALETLDARRDAISKPLEAACSAGKIDSCAAAQAFRVDELVNALGQGEFRWDEMESLIRATTGAVTAESQGNPMAINAQKNKDGSYKTDEKGNLIVNLINGKPDQGGLSYGLVQFASKVGGMEEFINFLQKDSGVSQDAKAAYDSLMHAGGLQGAKNGTPEFVQAWQNLTKDPQFQIYQLESVVRNGNMRNVEKYFEGLGINLSDLDPAKQEVVVAMVVQRAKSTKVDAATAFLSVSEDAKTVYGTMLKNGTLEETGKISDRLSKAVEVVLDAQKQLTAAESAAKNAESAAKNAESAAKNAALRVIELQDQSALADVAAAKLEIVKATQALDVATQKVEIANQNVARVQGLYDQASAQTQIIRDEWKTFFVENGLSQDASGKTIASESMHALLAAVKKVDPGRAVTLEKVIKKLYPVTP